MKPVLQALLLADHIYEDRETGKKVISGTFNQLRFKKDALKPKDVDVGGENRRQVVPGGMQVGSPYAFLSLTDLRGNLPFVLRYVDLKEYQVILQTEFTVSCDDPLQTLEIVVPLPKIPITKAGIHALELLCDDEPIGSLRISVEEIKDDESDND